jgi:hypothetical protein
MYVESNTEARSYNHCCSGGATSITYCEAESVCVCVFCTARNAHAPHCHLRPALLYIIFPHYLITGTI